jgi:hypothetical protein
MHESIKWKAVYENGTELPRFNEDGSENKYTDINRAKLEFFEIYKGDRLLLRLHLEEGRRLIYRRRVSKKVSTGEEHAVYLVGWQQTVNGKNVQDIAYIFEDEHIELGGKWKEDTRTFYAPNLIDCEKGEKNGD